MDVHDLHATILHLLWINHEELTFRYSGRDFRLTDVFAMSITISSLASRETIQDWIIEYKATCPLVDLEVAN